MRQLLQAIVATQQSAVEHLPLQLQAGENRCGVHVPPLPFGLNKQHYFNADGGAELATAEQLGTADVPEPQELWFYDPSRHGDAGGRRRSSATGVVAQRGAGAAESPCTT